MNSPEIPLPSDRSFGITFAVVFTIIGALQAWTGKVGVACVFFGLAITMLVVAWVRPAVLHGLNRTWMRFSALLHKVVSPLTLGAVYFLVLTPVSIAMRLGGRDTLRRKIDAKLTSYWIDRDPPGPPPGSLPNQF